MSDVSEAGPNAFMIHSLGSIRSIYWPIPFINDNFCYFWSQTKIPLKKAVASQPARLNIFSVLFPTYLRDKVTTLGLFTSSLLRIQLKVGGTSLRTSVILPYRWGLINFNIPDCYPFLTGYGPNRQRLGLVHWNICISIAIFL